MLSHNELANAVRALSMDAVQGANSGHPGMPMGMADIATVLWQRHLRHNPKNPRWFNRDRFVLSNGHGSMLQYALLHLTGYDLSLDDIKRFRQLHSKTPGHPELGLTPGVETTTGPLGQGLANAAGMALAERHLAGVFNQPGFDLVDHHTYVFLGDGCLMEGISHEACSLAGTLGLGKLIAFWDDNGISIDGKVVPWFSDDTAKRFEAYGWHVIAAIDGHDPEAVHQAILTAKSVTDKPSLLCCKTVIGFGAPTLSGSAKSHGSPLGEAEITKTREKLGWPYPAFVIPEAIYQVWDARESGKKIEDEWQIKWDQYEKAHPALAAELNRRLKGVLPDAWENTIHDLIHTLQNNTKPVATRKASQQCLNAIGPLLPELIGGSADLTGSNCTDWAGSRVINPRQYAENYLHYGVREFGMTAIGNGLALHGGIIPYTGTFLVFSDYARNAVRLSALMRLQHILIYSHDSIGLGEDGPTHQPIEHLASLRLIPHLHVWRPADSVETAAAWQHSVEHRQGPSCLLLSRQDLPVLTRNQNTITQIIQGGYILGDHNPAKSIDLILIATGSEVSLAAEAQTILYEKHQINARVVSMPCVEVFLKQDKDYQERVLPRSIKKRIAIEAGVPDTWYRFVGDNGIIIGIERFGESAPAAEVFQALGITVQSILDAALDQSRTAKFTR